ncbi:protein FAM180A [Maylandia zebra]|uniref:Protein FAM180A n=1 Tax=Pundamilia nyererei TaxID=303518 RepID=A0A9Y3R943_9CICH|nr:protein FAM180A [Maylandia zebra]XP_005730132.1 PREDICTED: protein FAM180B [Pundamilia nyererei]XP_014195338.1 protein FAM180A [Haplochromis burtoni]XP_026031578.1 protein FAM180B [Astatotilapia calliptera]
MTASSQLKIFLQVLLWLCFEQVLQDVAEGLSPAPQNTDPLVSNANLIYELLLGGVELDQDNNIVLLDEEMASMRQGRAFLSLINDNVPRSLSSMEQMADALEGQRSRPMMERQFENVVLSMVYTAHQAWHEKRKERQEAWGEVLLKLANITVHELRGNHLFRYS